MRMSRLPEFISHHPFLIGAAVLLMLALAVDETLRRMRKFKELPPAHGVLLINKGAAVLDLRSPAEFSAGHVIGARNIPLDELNARVGEIEKHKAGPLLLVCKSGETAAGAAARLAKQGFQQLAVLKGGIAAWQQEHFPLERS